MDPIEVTAALFGVASVYLSARQNVWNWPLGIINVTLYIFVFHEAKLYADMGLQAVYIVLAAYGWWHWLHGGTNRGALRVSRAPRREIILLTIAFVAGTTALSTLLARTTDASLPLADSALTAASLVAQYMMTRKYVECWLVWIAADTAYVAMFIYKSLWPTAGLYLLFTVLAVVGWRHWRASLREQSLPHAAFA
ncbi:MAG TPA: nicotinamide riboside transporter PnuC [Gemmatimonadaceae bacterium]|nr:nicotinamide riboside transporter PnuC [Gemmatimonadaceae bacterium]